MRFFRRKDRPPSEATLARQKAERELDRLRRVDTPKYQALGRALAEAVEENNLGRHLTEAFRGNR